jgi:hypothetical protein
MTSPTSYLQTLPQTEANAFVTSLQKVKEHLSQELGWISTQLQQKTVQLQGIEAILSEFGSVSTSDTAPVPPAEGLTSGNTSVSRLLDLETTSSPAPAAPSSEVAPARQPGKKPKSNSKPAAKASPKSAAKPKQGAATPGRKTKATAATTAEPNALRPFLQAAFQNQSLSDSIVQVLTNAAEPLSADNLMVELYEGLSSEDYKRAKRSLTNILSTGRSKGKWRSAERGLYTNNEATSA